MKTRFTWVLVLAGLTPAVSGKAQSLIDIEKFDQNSDGFLNEAELTGFWLRDTANPVAADSQAAERKADDVLSFRCARCVEVRAEDVEDFIQTKERREARSALATRRLAWRGLEVSREVVDNVNPRRSPLPAPAVFSYTVDKRAADSMRTQLNILGAVQFAYLGVQASRRLTLIATPGVDFDIEGSQAASESSLEFGLPMFARLFGRSMALRELIVGITPSFTTDRRFRRREYGGTLSLSFESLPLAAGYPYPASVRHNGRLPAAQIYWIPAVMLELDHVANAGGNELLQTIADEGTASRLGARAKITLSPNFISEQLKVDLDVQPRHSLNRGWNRHYVEGCIRYDLIGDGTVQATAVYRNGRRPPDFKFRDNIVLGIGIKF